jgi:hypothetical protein
MGFMQKQITVKQSWWQVETSHGTEIVPTDLVSSEPADSSAFEDYCEGEVKSWELIQGFGARLSAPGYMDCTVWAVFDTEAEANDYLDEMYGDDDADESEVEG